MQTLAYDVQIAFLRKGALFCHSYHTKCKKTIKSDVMLITDVYKINSDMKLKLFESKQTTYLQ